MGCIDAVGDAVGDPDGGDDGEDDGKEDGVALGSLDGEDEGRGVLGALDGLLDGAGLLVGGSDGAILGKNEPDGLSLGGELGGSLGDSLGEADGNFVGANVGAEVDGEADGKSLGGDDGTFVGALDGGDVVGGGVIFHSGIPVGAILGGVDGEADGKPVGGLLGADETVGCAEGCADGDPVGGSVFKIHKCFNADDNSSKLITRSGKIPCSLPGLSSMIHKADPSVTLDASPTPIANRATFISSSAFNSESYCVTASEFKQWLGPRTQSWYGSRSTQSGSLPRQNV